MKYVVVQAPSGEAPVLFPREFMHRYVADLLKPMHIVSAGFIRHSAEGLECYGRSAGLRLASRPEADTTLVESALRQAMP